MTKSAPMTAILAGGPGTRHLRVPKQILPFGDTTVLGKTLSAYLDAGISEVILVLGYKADLVEAEVSPLPAQVRVARNPLFDEGMFSFVRSGLREMASDRDFCIGLADQPLLTAELIGEFLEAFNASKGKILIPAFQGSLGLPAFFKSEMVTPIQSLSGRADLWDLLKENGDSLVDHPTHYSAVVRSIDDMDDYHALLQMAGLPIPDLPKQAPPEAHEEPAGDDVCAPT